MRDFDDSSIDSVQMMRTSDFNLLLKDVVAEVVHGAASLAILGLTEVTFRLLASLGSNGCAGGVEAIYGESARRQIDVNGMRFSIRPFSSLAQFEHDVLVVTGDAEKEEILEEALEFIRGAPKVIVSGYEHLKFHDAVLAEEIAQLLVPSFANGYPNTLTHIYQCLSNAARLDLKGSVAEFGMFKGGTTMLLSRLIERLGKEWPVIGFDSFSGFSARRSPLDMYNHPDCVFTDVAAVRRQLESRRVEIVSGDIVETCHRLEAEDLLLTFIDTDNYTPAKAAIDVVRERTVPGGSIVFDHFTGVDRFRYTLGERIAGKILLNDARYFHLHDTGVFFRQR